MGKQRPRPVLKADEAPVVDVIEVMGRTHSNRMVITTYDKIARLTNMHHKQVRKIVTHLRKEGYIDIDPAGTHAPEELVIWPNWTLYP